MGRPYLRAIRAHWFFAALFVAAVLVGSLFVLSRRSPTYEATAEVLVSPVDPADTRFAGLSVLRDLGDPTRTIQTAAALVENRDIADAAADRLGEPWTGERVEDSITVSPQGQTNVLEIRASADEAREAAQLANVYAAAVVQVRQGILRADVDTTVAELRAQLLALPPTDALTRDALAQRVAELELLRADDPTVSVAERAGIPSSSTGLSSELVLAIALGTALILAPGAALLIEFVGPRRVRDAGDVADVLGAPVLAQVPRGRRRRQRLASAHGKMERAAYRSLAVHVEYTRPLRSVMIVSPSRRDGRTSVAANLAQQLVRSDAKVAVADLDRAKPDLTKVLSSGPFPLLRVDPDLTRAEPNAYASPAELIRDASQVYDHVVIDTPPLLDGGDDVLRLTAAVDAVILVARCDRTLRAALEAAREQLAAVGATLAGGVLLGTRC